MTIAQFTATAAVKSVKDDGQDAIRSSRGTGPCVSSVSSGNGRSGEEVQDDPVILHVYAVGIGTTFIQ